MAKKIFLDTNIILDFLDQQRLNHQNATELIPVLILNNYTPVISEDMLSTIYYINKDREKVLKFFKSILSKWEVVPYGVDLIKQAVDISLEKGMDLEDLMQCLSAQKSECEVLITEDKGFYDCGIKIYSTSRFLGEN
ncbi:MAG: PIN domain-containing protein [Epsilonproteobacteria bacterium]|nr:PIN domain-containing protein [Campylobacterota bacterium]MBD3807318.1 PIN domain-containing protein [Campylobacterota bacterium]